MKSASDSSDVATGKRSRDQTSSPKDKRTRSESKKPYVVLAGNPGVGKSTILNSLVGHIVFRAGVSFGTGLTTRVQLHESPDIVYGDTPGLSDIKTREQAASEISSLLQKATYLKLVFVVTLEAGRVKPDDLTTMNLVLDSIDTGDMMNKFSIIVNKIPQNTYTELRSNPDHLTKVCASLTLKHKTSRIILVPKNENLEDAENVVVDPHSDVVELMNCDAVMVTNVKEINLNHAEEMVEHYRQEIKKINEASELELKRLREEIDRSRWPDSISRIDFGKQIFFPPICRGPIYMPPVVCGPSPTLDPIQTPLQLIEQLIRPPVIYATPPIAITQIQAVVEPIHTVVHNACDKIDEAVGKIRNFFSL